MQHRNIDLRKFQFWHPGAKRMNSLDPLQELRIVFREGLLPVRFHGAGQHSLRLVFIRYLSWSLGKHKIDPEDPVSRYDLLLCRVKKQIVALDPIITLQPIRFDAASLSNDCIPRLLLDIDAEKQLRFGDAALWTDDDSLTTYHQSLRFASLTPTG
jgi:hypothetical protein